MRPMTSLLAAATLLSTTAHAGEWSGEAALGFLATDGNTHSKSLNFKADAVWTQDPWKNTLSLAAINTSGDGSAAAERYAVGDKLDYAISKLDYLFGELQFEKDLEGAVRTRTSETAGYGRHVLTGPKHVLDLEIGAGLRQQEMNVTGDEDSEVILRGGGKYQWHITDVTSFSQTLRTEAGESNTSTEAVSELHMPVAGRLSAVLSYTLRNNSDVPPGVKHTDTAMAAALSYSFGDKGE